MEIVPFSFCFSRGFSFSSFQFSKPKKLLFFLFSPSTKLFIIIIVCFYIYNIREWVKTTIKTNKIFFFLSRRMYVRYCCDCLSDSHFHFIYSSQNENKTQKYIFFVLCVYFVSFNWELCKARKAPHAALFLRQNL